MVNQKFRDVVERSFLGDVKLSWTKKENPPVVQLLRTMLSRPALASHVRQVELLGRDFKLTTADARGFEEKTRPPKVEIAPDDQKIFQRAIKDLPLPYVSSWAEELRAGTMDALVALMLLLLPNLRSLRMERNFTIETRFLGSLFRSALCDRSCASIPAFDDLQDVVFGGIHSQLRSLCIPEGNTHHLLPLFYLPAAQSLDLFIDTPPSGVLDWPAGPPSLSNITSLALTMLREPFLEEVLAATPFLESLQWEWHYGPIYREQPWGQTIDIGKLASALRHVRNTLESLRIKAWADYGDINDFVLDPLEIRGTLRTLASFPKLRNLTAPWVFIVGFTQDAEIRLEDIIPTSVESLVLECALIGHEEWEWDDTDMVELFRTFFERRRADGAQLRQLEMVVPAHGAGGEWPAGSVARTWLATLCWEHDVKLQITTDPAL